eukprot:1016392-Pyramimonas_sp.AAC.1
MGSPGWLATQTRPDMSARLSVSQRFQDAPVVADFIEANRIVPEARRCKATGVTMLKMEGDLCILVFHEAARDNMDETDDKVDGVAWRCARRARTAFVSEAPKRLEAKG